MHRVRTQKHANGGLLNTTKQIGTKLWCKRRTGAQHDNHLIMVIFGWRM
jgi:hypothetical protein